MPRDQSRIAADLQARTLADVAKFLEKPFNQAAFDKWLARSMDRSKLLQEAFLGTIRWPKSVGRASGTLASGFALTLRNHFKIPRTGAGGEDMSQEGYATMPPPTVWEAPDDDTHYRVNYLGYYAKYGYVDRNELSIQILGSWDNPTKFARYLLLDPFGWAFGSFDGLPIILPETTIDQHFLTAKAPWVVKM